MRIAFNPSTVAALTSPPDNKDITFDLRGQNIFARGVKFYGTDTWRPVVDNLTSNSATSSLSANQGRVLAGLINGKSDLDHNHDGRYLKLTGGTLTGNLIGTSAMFSGRFYGNGDDEGIIIKPSSNGYAGLILGTHDGERSIFYFVKNKPFWRYSHGPDNLDIIHPKKSGTIALTSDIPSSVKNPYSLTTFGVVYDGSAEKVVSPSNFISQLEEGTSVVTDGTMFVTSYASDKGFADTNAVNVPYKRKAARLWDYIKAKTDSLYATKNHNHDDRYLKLTGGVLKGQIILPDIDVNTSYTGSIIIGASNANNLGIDGNEIMARNNGKASTLYLNNEGGAVQLGAILRTNSNIAYIGSQSTQNMIKFINNTSDSYGNGIAIGGGGLTIIGSGKSSDVVMGQHSSGGDENMIIAGDGNIDFYSNLQDGWKYGKHMYLDTNGFLFTPSYINIGGNENNNSSPDRVWGSNSSDSYLRSYRTSALRVAYAVNADTVDGVHANQLCRIYTFNVHDEIIKVGTLTSGQYGHVCKLRFNSGIGYNALNQDKAMTVVIRASNGNPNGNGFYFEAHSESYRGGAFTTFYLHQTSKTQCELYMAAFNHSGQSTYEVSFSAGDSWTNEISHQNALPTSSIFTLPNYQIAYSDYNIASATKLATARKIWGQSFDGTADVDNTLRIRKTTGNYCEGIRIQTGDGAWSTIILGATADSGTNTNAWSIHRKSDNNFAISRNSSDGANGLVMTPTGMGLGTTSPSYRLHVAGIVYTTSEFKGPYARLTDQNGALVIGDSTNARISAIGDQVVFNTGSALRFGGTDWEYSDWAGLKYDTTANTIYLGIAEGTVFNYNEKKRSNGIFRLAGITTVTPDSGARIGNTGGDLYLGNSNNSSWLRVQNMCSQESPNYWRIYQAGDAVFKKLNISGNTIVGGDIYISHAADGNMNYNTSNPRIVFSERGSQAVGLVYTDYDSYRDSKGLKVMDVDNSDPGNVWFEVQGYNYSSGYVKNGSNDNYILLGGGGHKAIRDFAYGNNYVKAFGTSNSDIDADWGQSFKTFDPIPSGTPPEQNSNISLLSICESFGRRKQLAFIWNNDNIYYRRHVGGKGFSNWRRLAFANEIPTSLPANGGNADTVDGEHANNFVRAGAYDSANLNSLDTYSFIKSVNSTVASASPNGNTGWYNVIQAVHRNGAVDGPNFIGQIALGMTTNLSAMFYRVKCNGPWQAWNEVVTTNTGLLRYSRNNVNISSPNCSPIPPSLLEWTVGYPRLYDPEFNEGNNNVQVYNNADNGVVTVTRVHDTNVGNSSSYIMKVVSAAGAIPNYGGWNVATQTELGKVYTCLFRASIPSGVEIEWNSNSIGTGGQMSWLTNNMGTGKWTWYAVQVYCGSGGSSTFFFSAKSPCTWYLSYVNVIENNRASYAGLRSVYSDYLKANASIVFGRNELQYFNQYTGVTAGATNNANPKTNWYHILRMNHANNSGYFVDLAIPFFDNRIQFRRITNGSDNGWRRVITEEPDHNVLLCDDSMGGNVYIGTNNTDIDYKLNVNGSAWVGGTLTTNSTFNFLMVGAIQVARKTIINIGSDGVNFQRSVSFDDSASFLKNINIRTGLTDYNAKEYSTSNHSVIIMECRSATTFIFEPGNDGQLLFMKLGKEYYDIKVRCTALDCVVVRAYSFDILIDKNTTQYMYGDGVSRFFIYESIANRWIEFRCG